MALNLTVDVKQFPSFEAALRRFRKRVERTGILEDYLSHLYYEKPSDRRRRKAAARKRLQKQGG